MKKVLVSACLLGRKVRYDGGDSANDHPVLARWRDEGRIVPVCPEVAGNLPVPRPPAELVGGDGDDVFDGEATVVTGEGADVTAAFVRGANAALELVREHDIEVAVLKEKSPSCGSKQVYDGQFGGEIRDGSGVTTALLRRHGVRVFGESEWEQAAAALEECG